MITNIDIDEDLVRQAMEVSGARSKREVVDRALREMVARAARPRVREIWGTANPDAYWPDYDPKTDPGEPAGKYRVEQGIASYKVLPSPPSQPTLPSAPSPSEPPCEASGPRRVPDGALAPAPTLAPSPTAKPMPKPRRKK
jgi:hypothetical protein